MENAQLSKASVKWGTPSDIVERARRIMGSIDLDPASQSEFNNVVKATRYYSLDERGEDGLLLPWQGRVFCNPPGQAVRDFWRKAINSDVQFIWVGFSLEQLTYLQDEALHPMDCCFVLLRKRLKFVRDDGYTGSPTHSNYICGYRVDPSKFQEEFSPLGRVSFGEHTRSTGSYTGT